MSHRIASPPEPFRVRVEQLRLGANPPAGMNVLVLMSLAYMLRSTAEDPEPVQVTRDGDGWRVHDGRHRAVAALIAGRPDVLSVRVDVDTPAHG
jgi:hypothetical protein